LDLSPGAETTLYALDWMIWAAFVLEYGIRLYLAPNKRYFVSHNVIDLLFVLIPVPTSSSGGPFCPRLRSTPRNTGGGGPASRCRCRFKTF
jgi:hypothetical protein